MCVTGAGSDPVQLHAALSQPALCDVSIVLNQLHNGAPVVRWLTLQDNINTVGDTGWSKEPNFFLGTCAV